MANKLSVFIKIDNYREILDLSDELRQQLEEVKSSYVELQNLRQEEEQELAAWKANLESVEQQLQEVDKTLFELQQ